MQYIHEGNIREHEQKMALPQRRDVREEMVQFILVNEAGTRDDLLRDFTDAEIDTHFTAAHTEARRRARRRSAH